MSPVGNIFGTFHQVLVLMQINITQFVLVRMPDGMGIFDPPSMEDELANGMRAKLLSSVSQTAINEGGDGETVDGEAPKPKNPLAALLTKLKENQSNDDNHMRA